MTPPSRHRKTIAWVAVTLASTVALVSFALAYPKQVTHPVLGGDWQCSRTAFMTSCSRIDRNRPAIHSLRGAPITFRQA